jgi:CDP-paratose 2-epimerase
MPRALVTGSTGLVGSQAVVYFHGLGFDVTGVDNNMRARFFGPGGDTTGNLYNLRLEIPDYDHRDLDVRDREGISRVLQEGPFDLIIHAAAQPSHDLASRLPFEDFEVNALGTLNILEAVRRHAPDAVFCFLSTNKVYGDAPNEIPLEEHEERWDYAREDDRGGIDETMRIDRSVHSLFGVSKAAADLLVQEYGRNFGLRTGTFRCGCITGARHAGVELHGFLSYLVKCAFTGTQYTIFGHKGKQVRDQIHAHDLCTALYAFFNDPSPGEVYNLGGGRKNSISIIEAVRLLKERYGREVWWSYDERARTGDHICYITNLGRICRRYPSWGISKSIDNIFEDLVAPWTE